MFATRWMTVVFAVFMTIATTSVNAAPYASLVMDARDGEVLYENDGDRRLHPASLTKMMTLYLAFEAVEAGRLRLDQKVKVSRHAARQVPSKIGLRPGQRVSVRDLIRAAAVKSANDAAVALAEAISGSESAFADAMTARARQLGMSSTTFKNASGLTAEGHLSTPRDMAHLGRALFYDYPQYYNLFGRRSTTTMGRTVYSTNRRLLRSYRGADGIKTGYTNAAGYNLVSSAERGEERVIAVVFGGRTSAWRNAKIAELMDIGFRKAPTHVAFRRWPNSVAVASSPVPTPRPGAADPGPAQAASLLAQAGEVIVPSAKASENPVVYTGQSPQRSPAPLPRPGGAPAEAVAEAEADGSIPTPTPRPGSDWARAENAEPATPRRDAAAGVADGGLTSAGDWAVQLGVFADEATAIAELTSAALSDVDGLSSARQEITQATLSGASVYRARLTGFDKSRARSVCNELKSRGQPCLPVSAPRS